MHHFVCTSIRKKLIAIAFCLSFYGQHCCPATLASSPALDKAIASYDAGKYTEAISLLDQAKATDFRDPVLHYYLANALLKVGAKAKAVDEYRLAQDLEPGGKIAQYCEAALRSLLPAPSKTTTAVLTTAKKSKESEAEAQANAEAEAAKKIRSQKPSVFVYLCGCPLCHRVEVMITDLHAKLGDQVTFKRTVKGATNASTEQLMKNYQVSTCPTVLLFDGQGKMVCQYSGVIEETKVWKDVTAMAASSNFTRLTGTDDQRLTNARNAIVSEVIGRVAADRLRIDNEIRDLQNAASEDPERRAVAPAQNRQRISPVTGRKIQDLKSDFARRKQEWFDEAEARLRSLGLTGSASKISRQDEEDD